VGGAALCPWVQLCTLCCFLVNVYCCKHVIHYWLGLEAFGCTLIPELLCVKRDPFPIIHHNEHLPVYLVAETRRESNCFQYQRFLCLNLPHLSTLPSYWDLNLYFLSVSLLLSCRGLRLYLLESKGHFRH